MRTKFLSAGLAIAMALIVAVYSFLGNLNAADYWEVYFVPDLAGALLGAVLGSLIVVRFVRQQRSLVLGFAVPVVTAVAVYFLVGAAPRVISGVSTYGDEMFAAFLPIIGTAWIAAYVYLIGGGILYAAKRPSDTTLEDVRYSSKSSQSHRHFG